MYLLNQKKKEKKMLMSNAKCQLVFIIIIFKSNANIKVISMLAIYSKSPIILVT